MAQKKTLGGILEVTEQIQMPETNMVPTSPSAGHGVLWIKNDTPNKIIFTDDAGMDWDLTDTGSGGSGGTVQGEDGTYDIQATAEGSPMGDARGEYSVDLQTQRSSNSQIASGVNSGIIAGENNTASATHSFVGAGYGNLAVGNYSIVGGKNNTVSGNGAIAFGTSLHATGQNALAVGEKVSAGYADRTFTVSGTTVTIAGVDVTNEFTDGDTITAFELTGGSNDTLHTTTRTISSVAFSTDTTFTISSALDDRTGGQIASQAPKGAFAFGYSVDLAAVRATGVASVVGGYAKTGYTIISSGNASFAFGYAFNENVSATGLASLVLGGTNNRTQSNNSAVIGGYSNEISTGAYSSGIFCGDAHEVSTNAYNSVIVGGVSGQMDGEYSVIIAGNSNNISGNNSVILGGDQNTITSNNSGILAGNNNNVSGTNAVVIGGTYCESSGYNSSSGGRYSSASGNSAFAFGYGTDSTYNIESNGLGSVAMGYAPYGKSSNGIVSSNKGSVAMGRAYEGYDVISSGEGSVSLGYGTSASNTAAFACGKFTSASEIASWAGGFYSYANSYSSFAFGYHAQVPVSSEHSMAFGFFCKSSSLYTWSSGKRAHSDKYGQCSRANGNFSADGDAQTSMFVLRNQTTDATQTELFLDGDVGGSHRMVLANDTTWVFHVTVVARRTDANDESAGYIFEGVIDRNAGVATTAIVGVVNKTQFEDTAAWDTVVDADTTNGALRIQVTGEAAKNINWVAYVRTTETTG